MGGDRLIQRVFDRMISIPDEGTWNRRIMKYLRKIRKRAVAQRDPIVAYRIGPHTIRIPLSHELPFHRKRFPHYAGNLVRIAGYAKGKYPELSVIDIGANIGDSLALLREFLDPPVLCIEGDDDYFRLLEENSARFPGVEIEKSFVGDRTVTERLQTKKAHGTARLVTSEREIPIRTLADILTAHPAFSRSKLIKIDTDGYDNFIIRGSLGVLRSMKPVLFFEYDPYLLSIQGEEGYGIFRELKDAGYCAMLVYDNYGEYLLSTELDAEGVIEDIHHLFSGRRGEKYCDLCVFHVEDRDLYAEARRSEILYFKNARGY